jgi:hypothetical protein
MIESSICQITDGGVSLVVMTVRCGRETPCFRLNRTSRGSIP